MNHKKLLKPIAAAVLSSFMVFGVHNLRTANATGIPVVDGGHIAVTQAMFQYIQGQIQPILQDINAGLNGTGTQGSSAMKAGEVGSLMDVLRSVADLIDAENAAVAGYQKETDQRARLRDSTRDIVQDNIRRQKTVSTEACIEITRSGGRGGTASAASVAEKKTIDAVINRTKSTTSNAENAGNVLMGRAAKGMCRAEDVKVGSMATKVAGCSAPGDMPGADANIDSIFNPATKPEEGSSLTFNNGKGTAISATKDQALAANMVIANLTASMSPLMLEEAVGNKTMAGKDYNAKKLVYDAIQSAAIKPLAVIASRRQVDKAGLQAIISTSTGGNSTWKDEAPIWKRLFPHAASAFPDAPSEAEMIRFEVMRRYADASAEDDNWNIKLQSSTGDEISKEIARSQAIELYLLYQISQRLEENNSVVAAILARDLTGITKAEMDGLAQKARSAKN